jgi:carboxyl-terminal processing protease
MPKSTNAVEEVWTLIDKYYVDQTFHGQDWKQVKQKYLKMIANNINDDDDAKVMDAVTRMVKSLGDKYTRILTKEAYAAIQKYDLIGVGVTLMPNEDKQLIVGAPPIKGSQADKAGLKEGDFIDAVNGIQTQGRTAFDIIDQISDNPTAKTVTMTVRRPTATGPNDLTGGEEGTTTRDVVMERQTMEIKDPVQYKLTERRPDGTVVGYIRISEFNSLVKAKLEEAITDLESRGVNAIVLDLRGNPGGAFQSAVEISSLFYENKVATYVVDSNHVELPFKTASGRVMIPSNQPIAIWLDGSSASASEVLAGSLRDNCRAIVMGEKSFGKGLIQAVYGLKNGAGLVLTVAKYITPKGYEIQGNGIVPDIKDNVPNRFFQQADTTKVDFADIANRLGPDMCQTPYQHTAKDFAIAK